MMQKNLSRLCPFCEGLIDYHTDECPYCGSHLECEEVALSTTRFIPLYQAKTKEPLIETYKTPLSQRNVLAIFLGGGMAPLSFFLWLLGRGNTIEFSIETTWFPLITIAAIAAIIYGFSQSKSIS